MNKLIKVHEEVLKTKYQSPGPSSFRRRRILKIGFFVPMFQHVTPWMGPILTQEHHMNKFGRGPLEDATYQI